MELSEVKLKLVRYIERELWQRGMRYEISRAMMAMAFKASARPLVEQLQQMLNEAFPKRVFLVYEYIEKRGMINMIAIHRIA